MDDRPAVSRQARPRRDHSLRDTLEQFDFGMTFCPANFHMVLRTAMKAQPCEMNIFCRNYLKHLVL
jgi:hypothetical protein